MPLGLAKFISHASGHRRFISSTITQFRVGLLEARIKDERIPAYYGMLGQETNGAGGIHYTSQLLCPIYHSEQRLQSPCRLG
jgi:hypothetical protein